MMKNGLTHRRSEGPIGEAIDLLELQQETGEVPQKNSLTERLDSEAEVERPRSNSEDNKEMGVDPDKDLTDDPVDVSLICFVLFCCR